MGDYRKGSVEENRRNQDILTDMMNWQRKKVNIGCKTHRKKIYKIKQEVTN